MSKDFDKLKSMIALLEPGAIYVSGTKPFAAALAAIKPLHSAKIVSGGAGDADAISFRSIAATPETPDVERPLPRSRPTRSQNSCSPRVRPARRRPSSTPSAC